MISKANANLRVDHPTCLWLCIQHIPQIMNTCGNKGLTIQYRSPQTTHYGCTTESSSQTVISASSYEARKESSSVQHLLQHYYNSQTSTARLRIVLFDFWNTLLLLQNHSSFKNRYNYDFRNAKRRQSVMIEIRYLQEQNRGCR